MSNVFHKNIPNNLECLEHLRKCDEISFFSRHPSIKFSIESTKIFFHDVIRTAFVEFYLGPYNVYYVYVLSKT